MTIGRMFVLFVLFVVQMLCVIWLKSNWSAIQSNGGIGTAYELGALALPSGLTAIAFGVGLYLIWKDNKTALHADPPAPADDSGNSLIQFKLPGVSLRLVVDVEKAKDKSFRDSIVASVKSGLDVRAATEAAKS